MVYTVGIILINPEKKLLLHLRDDIPTIPFPNHWSLIGGGIEKNETPLDAVKREMKEEIGLEAEDIELIKGVKSPTSNITLLIFKGKINERIENIILTEGKEVRYFQLNELPDLKMPQFLREFIFNNKEKIL